MKHIAIAGLGVVGGGVAEILLKNAALLEKNAGEPIALKAIYTRHPKTDGPFAPYFVSDFEKIEKDPQIDLVVETIGGSTVAFDLVSRALKAGKHVVTANKQLIAEHGLELFALAKAHGVNLLFEASVAGGIPILNPLTRCLGANEITEVSGILNGTTNYILTQMLENGESYADALSNAQRLGYAEADPTADVEGIDAARKSCILSGLAFGKNVSPDDIHVEGISKVDALDAAFAESGGMKIKLLGRTLLQNGKRFCFVSPHFIQSSALLAGVNDVFNAVCVRGSEVGEVLFAGPGAGRYPTASAVVGDIIDIVKNPGRVQPACWDACEQPPADFAQFCARFYLRAADADKSSIEQKLGKIRWLPDRSGCCAGFTELMPFSKIADSGVAIFAAWPIFE